MKKGKSYSIHKGKQSQATNSVASRRRLRKTLEETSHRMHTVTYVDEIEFIDDTKAEDLLSTRDSFKCLEKPSVWLTVATPHERDFTLIEKYIKKSIKAIVAYGGDTEDMREKLEGFVDTFESASELSRAVEASFELAEPEDLIIYSPSCKAQDGYLNYVDRSRAYSKFISELENNE